MAKYSTGDRLASNQASDGQNRILAHWTTVSYDRGIHVSSHRNEVKHRVRIREWPDRPKADVIHECRAGGEKEWETVTVMEV